MHDALRIGKPFGVEIGSDDQVFAVEQKSFLM